MSDDTKVLRRVRIELEYEGKEPLAMEWTRPVLTDASVDVTTRTVDLRDDHGRVISTDEGQRTLILTVKWGG
jgi:hypothetical protein